MTIIYGESKLDFKHAKQNFYAFLKGLKLHDHKLQSCKMGKSYGPKYMNIYYACMEKVNVFHATII